MSQEPSNQQQSTVDAVAVSPSTSSDTSTNGDDGSEEEDGQPALQPQSNSMSPSPRAVIPSPAHRQEQVRP